MTNSNGKDSDVSDRRSLLVCFLIFVFVSVCVSLAVATFYYRHEVRTNVFHLANYLGPVTYGLATTGKMVMFRSGPPYVGTVPFYGARMPFPVYLVFALSKVFGSKFLLIKLAKTLLLLIPLHVAVWISLASSSQAKRAAVLCFVSLPFIIPSFLLISTSLQVEEGYFYSFLAVAFALVIYERQRLLPPWWVAIAFVCAVDLVYLTKSSMRLTCLCLIAAMLIRQSSRSMRIFIVAATMIAPIAWGSYLSSTSGRFSIGSSVDGFNFHKGNYPQFIDRYPPIGDGNLDQWDGTLTASAPIHSEWEDNDDHMTQGLLFLHNPQALSKAFVAKVVVFFFSLEDVGTGHRNDIYAKVSLVNMALFRLLLLGAIVWSMANLIRRRERFASLCFLSVVLATAAPYVIGFALTRHATVLIFPSALALAYYSSRGALHNRRTSGAANDPVHAGTG